LRWFGLERVANKASWECDITEIGYKYQMTDVSAALGLAGLEEFKQTLQHRQKLLAEYFRCLEGIAGVKIVGNNLKDREHAAWICTILVDNRANLQKKLAENAIESSQVHFRNDRYSIFGQRRKDLPNMDAVENNYLVLPLHTKMNVEDVQRVCSVIRSGW
jgi:perosamine synthetase